MLALELVGIGRLIGFTKRRINHHLFLVGMLVECMGELHQKHLALECLGLVGGQHLVENRQRHVVLGGKDLVPVARRGFHALHQRLAAVVRRETDCRSADRGGDDRGGMVAPRESAEAAGAAVAGSTVT